MKKGEFIVIDGIDASGKGVIERHIKEYETSLDRRIFDTSEFCELNPDKIPELRDFSEADIIFNAEPSYYGIGKCIREEIISRNGRDYSFEDQIEAYSLDRLVNMKRIVIPAIENGIRVIQSRCLASTLAYQIIKGTTEAISEKNIKKLILSKSGNILQLSCHPDLLLIPSVTDGKEVERRIEARKKEGKDDNCEFENADFQTKISKIYGSDELKKIFTSRGTRVEYIDGTISPEYTRTKALELYQNFLSQ